MVIEVKRKVTEQYPYYYVRQYTYLRNGKEVARELFDRAGALTEAVGKIPDDQVNEYYESGLLKGEMTYRNGKRDGKAKEYYDSGELMKEVTYANGLKEGTAWEYYEDGVLEGEWHYVAGKLDGPARKYYPSGKLMIEKNYKSGVLDGDYRWYYENGTVWKERRYADGEIDEKSVKEYDQTGAPVLQHVVMKVVAQYPNKRAREIDYFRNEMVVAWRELDINGAVLSKDGRIPDGSVQEFSKEGYLMREIGYVNGIQEGITREYFKNGDLKAEVPFKNGKRDGQIRAYYESGMIKQLTYFKDGQFFMQIEHVE